MRRSANASFVKPMLEELEERAQPSFLVGTNVVPQLAQPLNNIVTDMKNASTDLQTQFNLIKTVTPPANTFAGAEVTADKAVADWQRILTDSAAINAVVNVDLNAIHTIALAEFQNGDSLDLLVLTFGQAIGFNATAPLTNTVTQSNNILNDPTLQSIVNTNLHSLNNFVDSTTPIAQETFPVTF